MNLKWRIAQAAEIRWWRRYLGRKDPGAYRRQKEAYWKKMLERTGLAFAPQARVLDAGCGPAGIFLILREQKVDAIDPLLEAYARQLPYFAPADYPWVRFEARRLEDLKAVAVYDAVFCLNAINHVADLETALDRLLTVARPGAPMVISVDVHRSFFLKQLFRLLPGDVLHPHQHSLDDYLARLKQRGCRIRKVERLKPGRIFDYYLIVAER